MADPLTRLAIAGLVIGYFANSLMPAKLAGHVPLMFGFGVMSVALSLHCFRLLGVAFALFSGRLIVTVWGDLAGPIPPPAHLITEILLMGGLVCFGVSAGALKWRTSTKIEKQRLARGALLLTGLLGSSGFLTYFFSKQPEMALLSVGGCALAAAGVAKVYLPKLPSSSP